MGNLSKDLLRTKITQKAIAKKFNTSVTYVNDVLNNRVPGKRGKAKDIKDYAKNYIQNNS